MDNDIVGNVHEESEEDANQNEQFMDNIRASESILQTFEQGHDDIQGDNDADQRGNERRERADVAIGELMAGMRVLRQRYGDGGVSLATDRTIGGVGRQMAGDTCEEKKESDCGDDSEDDDDDGSDEYSKSSSDSNVTSENVDDDEEEDDSEENMEVDDESYADSDHLVLWEERWYERADYEAMMRDINGEDVDDEDKSDDSSHNNEEEDDDGEDSSG